MPHHCCHSNSTTIMPRRTQVSRSACAGTQARSAHAGTQGSAHCHATLTRRYDQQNMHHPTLLSIISQTNFTASTWFINLNPLTPPHYLQVCLSLLPFPSLISLQQLTAQHPAHLSSTSIMLENAIHKTTASTTYSQHLLSLIK